MPNNSGERRDFIKKVAAITCGGVASLVPIGAGIGVILDPLHHKAEKQGATKVTTLAALPADGVPRKYSIIASRVDAWNRYAAVPVGAIYLRRLSETEVEAYNVTCPHAGCFVEYLPEKKSFLCPCHNSTFAIDGRINDRKSPSPRGMDRLKVELLDGEVFVHFKNFRAGEKEQISET